VLLAYDLYKKIENELTGSASRISAVKLYENGKELSHIFTAFGVHSQEAGLSFPIENFYEVKKAFNNQIRSQLTEEQFKQEIRITKEITLEQMTEGLVEKISDFAPFGIGNEEPVFLVHDKPAQIRQIGQQQNHL